MSGLKPYPFCGGEKTRYQRTSSTRPTLDGPYKRWTDGRDTMDRDYPDKRVRREYEDIMREDVDQTNGREADAAV